NSIVLDLGAGYCNFINHIVAKEKHASDISEIIRQNAEKGVICHIQDCAELSDISDEKFDIVFESNLLEHLDSDHIEKTLEEILRVLKKGGRFIAMQPNFTYLYKNYFDDYTHKTILSHVSFENLLKNYGFEIENMEPKFLPATFFDLGDTALANSFLKKEDLGKPEPKYPLKVYFCDNCGLNQLTDVVEPKILFKDYVYFSSDMPVLPEHFRNYANEVVSNFTTSTNDLVVEIGSNDGLLLGAIKNLGVKVLGVDPAENIAKIANEKGVTTIRLDSSCRRRGLHV
ncbi:MAG: Methyltransferase type 11, partial [Candidatus Curtissbacteria bacterium GW2011_GWA1_40_24]